MLTLKALLSLCLCTYLCLCTCVSNEKEKAEIHLYIKYVEMFYMFDNLQFDPIYSYLEANFNGIYFQVSMVRVATMEMQWFASYRMDGVPPMEQGFPAFLLQS